MTETATQPRIGLREKKNARTRAAITRAALELIVEDGFDGATVARIAERADVAPRTVHAWFPTKEDIVLGGSDVPIDRLAAELADGDGDTLARIRRWIESEGALRTEPDDVARLRHRVLLADPHLRAAQRSRQQAVEALIASAIAEEVGLPADAVAPRALAAAVVTSLLAMQERFAGAEGSSASYGSDFAGVADMLGAALDRLRDHEAPAPRRAGSGARSARRARKTS
jgi:AcrR family transcriptional regulator